MKTNILISALVFILAINAFGQKESLELTFTAIDNASNIALDSIQVMNCSQDCDTVLHWPDTLLTVELLTGIVEQRKNEKAVKVFQNSPNPIINQTEITLYVPEKGLVNISISNILGHEQFKTSEVLTKGYHTFRLTPGSSDVYFFTAYWRGTSSSIKMLNAISDKGTRVLIDYSGPTNSTSQFKSVEDVDSFVYGLGDRLLCIGYANTLQSGIIASPEANELYTFQLATNIPCPGTATVTYEGQTYNTVQIFGQCWMNENLNVGTLIPHTQSQANNNTIEKYCLMNSETYCTTFGGLYAWNETMQYANEPGSQGICPEGWHIPDDLDWQILEGAVDSQYRIGNPVWENYSWRGNDAGGNLKQTGTINWEPPNSGATDLFGFTALPGGYIVDNGFWGAGYKAYFWSSAYPDKFFRNIDWNQVMIKKDSGGDEAAISVRCMKDY